jgi:tRNA (mo5U34)-methyltransferase
VWLERCGFLDVRVVDVTPTSVKEQRSTEWMRFHSLMDFLDPKDPGLTVEGHPAPRRGILVARA